MRSLVRTTSAALGALLLLGSSGCVAFIDDSATPLLDCDRPADEPICVDWRVETRKLAPEALGYWGASRDRIKRVVKDVVVGANLAPSEHAARPVPRRVLNVSLSLKEVRQQPGYALNLLSVSTLGLVPYRTEYDLTVLAEQAEPELKAEVTVRIVSWTQLFLIFYPWAYSADSRSEPFEDALQAATRHVCAELIRQVDEARAAAEADLGEEDDLADVRESVAKRDDVAKDPGGPARTPNTDYRGPRFGDEPEGEVYPAPMEHGYGPIENGHGPVESGQGPPPFTGDDAPTPPVDDAPSPAPRKRRNMRLCSLRRSLAVG